MSKRRHTAEQIIGKLQEAEVQLAQSIPQKYIDEIPPPQITVISLIFIRC